MVDDPRASRFPWPLGLVVAALLVALGIGAQSLLAPPLVAGLTVYLLLPFRRQPWVLRTLVAVGLVALLWIVAKFGWLLFVLGTSVFLAYVLDPAVTWLERRRWRRSLAAMALLIPVVGLFGVILLIFLPPLFQEGRQLLAVLPEVPAKLEEVVRPWLRDRGLDPGSLATAEGVPALLERARAILSHVLNKVISLSIAAGSLLSGLALVPFCTFYLLQDARRAIGRGAQLMPPKYHAWFRDLAHEMDRLLGHWLRGVLLVALVMGVLTFLGLLLFQVPYALLLAVLAALLNVIPVIGFWVSFVVAGLVGLTAMGFIGFVKVAVLYLVLNVLEGQLLQPRLVGQAVGLHPLVTFLALIVFSSLFGIVGAFLAVPLALFVGILTRQMLALYRGSDLYTS